MPKPPAKRRKAQKNLDQRRPTSRVSRITNNKTSKTKSNLLFLATTCGVIIVFSLTAFNLFLYSSKYSDKVSGVKKEERERHVLREDKASWEKFLKENPTYIDGWLKLAKIAHKLGDKNYAEYALSSATSIDPNSKRVRGARSELGLFGF